jgi:hypothetical protein
MITLSPTLTTMDLQHGYRSIGLINWEHAARSNSVCPAVKRAAAAAFSAANSTSSWAEPRCSIEREPRRQDHMSCIAVAPGAVFTVRTNATNAAYGPTLVFNFRRIRTHNSTSISRGHARSPNVSQVRTDGG